MPGFYREDSVHWIKSCEEEQIPRMMALFGSEWNAGHIMATSKSFIHDYFYNEKDNQYTILIAGKQNDNEILGMLCFVENTFFDESLTGDKRFVWLTNWLVRHDAGGGLGLKLLDAVSKWRGGAVGTLGISAEALPIYRALRYHTGVLKQYFLAHDEKENFVILKGFHGQRRPCQTNTEASLEAISPETLCHIPEDGIGKTDWQSIFEEAYPTKTPAYIYHKYLNPKSATFRYRAYSLDFENTTKGFLVIKTENHSGARVLRIVEYAGKSEYLQHTYSAFQKLLRKHDAEYVDFCCEGIDEYVLTTAGFQRNTGQNGLVVPDYFHPYQSQNIEIAYAYKHMPPGCRIYRGDGDREHPRNI